MNPLCDWLDTVRQKWWKLVVGMCFELHQYGWLDNWFTKRGHVTRKCVPIHPEWLLLFGTVCAHQFYCLIQNLKGRKTIYSLIGGRLFFWRQTFHPKFHITTFHPWLDCRKRFLIRYCSDKILCSSFTNKGDQ